MIQSSVVKAIDTFTDPNDPVRFNLQSKQFPVVRIVVEDSKIVPVLAVEGVAEFWRQRSHVHGPPFGRFRQDVGGGWKNEGQRDVQLGQDHASVIHQRLVFAHVSVVELTRIAQPRDGSKVAVLLSFRVALIGQVLNQFAESDVVTLLQRLGRRELLGPVASDNLRADQLLEVVNDQRVVVEPVVKGGINPVERMPHEEEFAEVAHHLHPLLHRVVFQQLEVGRIVRIELVKVLTVGLGLAA